MDVENESESVFELLDLALLKLQPQLARGDVDAVRIAIQISDRRCKLLGLDAPVEEAISRGVAAELNQLFAVLEQVLSEAEFERVMAAIAHLSASA